MKKIFLPLLILTFLLAGFGCQTSTPTPVNSSINVSNSSTSNTPTNTNTNIPTTSENISVTSPSANETVSNPIHVTGSARVFENVVSWRLKDSKGAVLTNGTTEAAAPDVGQFGDYDFWLVVPEVLNANVTLEVFQASAKDGSDADLVSVPLKLESLETTDLKVYFHNDKMDLAITCTTVFSVTRKIITTNSPARAAMVLLLQGPTDLETVNNYSTIIPFPSELKDIALSSDGLLTVDLGGAIAGPIGGSCLVGGIGAEIEETLKQFSTVKEVKILINGEADKLQP